MSPVEDMIEAFQQYYSSGSQVVRYNDVQRRQILRRLGTPPKEYLLDLFRGVIEVHEARFRTLPDVAVISKIANTLDAPGTYAPVKALPEPPIDPQEVERLLKQSPYTIDDAIVAERDRVAARKGNMTRCEKWWLLCRGVWKEWKPMPDGWDEPWNTVFSKYQEAR